MGPADLRVRPGRPLTPRRRRVVRGLTLFLAGAVLGVLAALLAPIPTTEDG